MALPSALVDNPELKSEFSKYATIVPDYLCILIYKYMKSCKSIDPRGTE